MHRKKLNFDNSVNDRCATNRNKKIFADENQNAENHSCGIDQSYGIRSVAETELTNSTQNALLIQIVTKLETAVITTCNIAYN
ncbi:hypothetical protein SAMN05421636_103482 [Pricia antarctica]|uniref:Uncharacterized protein n=1 Tax=Pricia antarctica TaxID=641691 RepID=A0A1G7APJ6_9FLAO|nr:hypothetical protein SAMN05421636_103482 [Pricia antarctica]